MVMVAAVLLGFIALGVSKVIQQAHQGQAQVQRNTDFAILTGSISSALSRPEICAQALRNGSGQPTTVDFSSASVQLRPLDAVTGRPSIAGIELASIWFGNAKIVEKDERIAPGLSVETLGLLDTGVTPVPATIEAELPADVSAGTGPQEYGRAFGVLYIEAKKSQGASGVEKVFEKRFPLEIMYHLSSQKIASCAIDGSALNGFFSAQVCEDGEVMVGVGPEGLVCELIADIPGSKEFVPYNSPLPPDYDPISCSVDKGKKVVENSCVGKKYTCEFKEGGWQLLDRKNGKKKALCLQGVTGVLRENEINFARDEALPAGVSTGTHEVSCKRGSKELLSCNSTSLQSPAEIGNCFRDGGRWNYVHKVKGNGDPKKTPCKDGMRAVPL